MQGMTGPASSPALQTRKNALFNPLAFVRRRFRDWWLGRLPLSDNVTLNQRNVYILPTGPGWMLAATLLVLLVASINYQLNLGYLLTFLLAGSALVGMQVSHRTLRGLAMHLIAPSAQFAGATAVFNVKFTNSRGAVRHGIGLSVLSPMERPDKEGKHWAWTDVPAQSSSTVQIAFMPGQRGLHRLPTLTAETRFPLGTFRVWTVWRPAAQIMVYPAPETQAPPLPAGAPRSGGAAAIAQTINAGEFDGVRAYRRGDPMKRVVWKKATKADEQGNGLVVRDEQQTQRHELWLDFAHTGLQTAGGTNAMGREAKLSRLCAWVLKADQLGLRYGLRLPTRHIAPDSGEAHKRQCLEALALC